MTPSVAWREEVQQHIEAAGAVAILRLSDHRHALSVGSALADAGMRSLEVTFNHPDACATVEALAGRLPAAVRVEAGTIRSCRQLADAKSAGARFCVSPHTDRRLIIACLQASLEPLPGACTATEVMTAVDAGARLAKLFPARPLGRAYLKSLRAPFPEVGFVPTGGIAHGEVLRWLNAGAAAVGLGWDLIPADPVQADLAMIAERARRVVGQVKAARHG